MLTGMHQSLRVTILVSFAQLFKLKHKIIIMYLQLQQLYHQAYTNLYFMDLAGSFRHFK